MGRADITSQLQPTLTCTTVSDMKQSLHYFSIETDKSWAHQYIHVYEALFEPIRANVQNVLEIGVMDGDSLRMWRDYFDQAQICGIDIDDRTNRMVEEERINVIIADAYTPEAMSIFDTKFDVIVDDGPHSLVTQMFCAQHYSNLLSSNGVLVIEDIPSAEWIPHIASVVPEHLKPYMYGIDRRIAPNRMSLNDELMFVIDLRFVQLEHAQ